MKKKNYFLAVLLIGVLSCQTSKEQDIIYSDNEVSEMAETNLEVSEIDTHDFFAEPEGMDFVLDSLIVVFDRNNNEKVCHVINKNGNLLASFGMKGKSDTEFIQPMGFTVSKNRDSVYVYDSMVQKLVCFDIRKVLSGADNNASVIDIRSVLDKSGEPINRIWYMKCLDEDRFIGVGKDANRFVTISGEQVAAVYKEYPAVEPDEECNWAIWNSISLFGLSPDRKKAVVATYYGALMEILNVDNGQLSHDALKAYYKPKYALVDGAKPQGITSCAETIHGFSCLYTSNDFFITSLTGRYVGKSYQYGHDLLVYGYDGVLQKRLNIGDDIEVVGVVAVADNGDIYFFGKKEDGVSRLYMCNMDV